VSSLAIEFREAARLDDMVAVSGEARKSLGQGALWLRQRIRREDEVQVKAKSRWRA